MPKHTEFYGDKIVMIPVPPRKQAMDALDDIEHNTYEGKDYGNIQINGGCSIGGGAHVDIWQLEKKGNIRRFLLAVILGLMFIFVFVGIFYIYYGVTGKPMEFGQ